MDLAARRVEVAAGEPVGYDQLVVATGAHPIVPAWAHGADGGLVGGVGPVKTLDDGEEWLRRFAEAGPGSHVVVVGGGYIGLEVAEAALRRGFGVTVVTRSRVMSSLEPELSDQVALTLTRAGVEVVLDAEVTGLDVVDGRADRGPLGRRLPGVRPAWCWPSAWCRRPSSWPASGLELGEKGAAAPGPARPGRRAGLGRRRLLRDVPPAGRRPRLPSARHACQQDGPGRWGDSLAGGSLTFDGILETAITRFAAGGQYVEVARTGLSLEDARAADYDPVAVATSGSTASGYLDEADPVDVWVMADRASRRLLGVQVVGGRGAGKRIDTAAAVLWAEGTVDDLAWMDLSYAPPFSTTWEVLGLAARRAAERL